MESGLEDSSLTQGAGYLRPVVDLRALYTKHAANFDSARTGSSMEEPYLRRVSSLVGGGGSVLDIGCGSSEPIARFFIERGYDLVGYDFSEEMLRIARARFPRMEWVLGDMRDLDLGRTFDVVIAWDSFFHLSPADQRRMFPRFRDHLRLGGVLLFTSGTKEEAGVGGDLFGDELFHGSLSTAEYSEQLSGNGIEVVSHRVEDPDCGGHTIWIGRRVAFNPLSPT